MTAAALSRAINGQAPHVARYLVRVDVRLSELPDDAARRFFLAGEIERWQERYATFQQMVDAGRDTPSEISAFDYIETMAALDERMGRLE